MVSKLIQHPSISWITPQIFLFTFRCLFLYAQEQCTRPTHTLGNVMDLTCARVPSKDMISQEGVILGTGLQLKYLILRNRTAEHPTAHLSLHRGIRNDSCRRGSSRRSGHLLWDRDCGRGTTNGC